jgi:acyl dehydratase
MDFSQRRHWRKDTVMVGAVAELKVGQRLPERTFDVTRTAVVRYAGASGDFNPLHHDDAAAKAAGMPGAFAHGMFSAGCLATAVTDVAGVESLSRLAVRFRAQASLGTTLTSDIVVATRRGDGDRVLVDLECRLIGNDAAVVVSATATLSTPPRPRESAESTASPTQSTSELVGRRLASAVVTVERGPAQVFATAVNDDNPVYQSPDVAAACGLDGIPIPPTYLFAVANWGAFGDQQPQAAPGSASLVELIGLLRNGRAGVILHGEQEFTYYTPVRVGDVLHVDGHVERVEHKPGSDDRPGMTVMVVRTDYRNASENVLATARATYLFRPSTR